MFYIHNLVCSSTTASADYTSRVSQEVVITLPVSGSVYCTDIVINEDILVEGDEMFLVSLTTNDPAVDLANDEAQITILDNDRKTINVDVTVVPHQ